MKRKWIVWGAGRIGKSMCRLLQNKGEKVIAIIDMNQTLHGKEVEGITICDKKILHDVSNCSICVAVDGKFKEISNTLITECQIDANVIFNYVQIIQNTYMKKIDVPMKKKNKKYKVIFQCDGGLGLGGVETWCLTFGSALEKNGIDVRYLIPAKKRKENLDNVILIEAEDFFDFGNVNVFNKIVEELVNNLPCTVVTNYKFLGYLAACMVKSIYPNDIRVISVVHGGKQAIFDWNVLYKKYIDYFIGVSKYGICNKLIENGIDKEIVDNIVCPVPIDEKLEHTYSAENKPLKLAYAGRLTLRDRDKRVDLLIPLIEGLQEKAVNYYMEIAGEGDYKKELEQYVESYHLEDKIKICGLIERKDMRAYWQNNDIFINVSDSEGNCMAMLEALSQGCVPVVTDVSGVRDSIRTGYNGFIVEKRDIASMVDIIKMLDSDRSLLCELGRKSHNKMLEIYGGDKMVKRFIQIVCENINEVKI